VTVRYLGYKAERRRRYNSQPAPVFTQDFTTGGGGALPPGSTFSRGTIGTLYNSQGLVAYAPSNLLTYSNTFNNAAWVASGGVAALTTNVVAPDGTLSYIFVSSNANAVLFQVVTGLLTVGQTYTLSLYVLSSGTPITSQLSIYYNAGSGYDAVKTFTTSNTWQRVTLTFTVVTTTAPLWFTLGGNGTLPIGASLYIWGAQLEQSPTATTYTPTTTAAVYGPRFDYDPTNILQQNLYTYSGGTSGPYVYVGATVYPNVAQAPDGTYTAWRLVEDTSTGTHVYSPSSTWAPVVGQTYTWSFYVKASGRTFIYVQGAGINGQGYTFACDLTAGTVTTPPPGGTITPVGNGWYYCQFTLTASGASNITVLMCNTAANFSYTGDGASGIFLWGFQVSQTAAPKPFLPTGATAQTICAPKGLLIEESRTNTVLWSTAVGGTNGWVQTGATTAVNSSTAPDGTTTASLISEDTSVTAQHAVYGGTTVSASTAIALTCYIKASGRSYAYIQYNDNISSAAWTSFNLTTGAVVTAPTTLGGTFTNMASSAVNVGNGWFRVIFTLTTNTVANGTFYIGSSPDGVQRLFTGSGAAAIYVWGAQCEIGAFPTSYIPTTAATVTRAADICSAPVPPSFNTAQGTFVAIFDTVIGQTLPPRVIGGAPSSKAPIQFNVSTPSTYDGTAVNIGASGSVVTGVVLKAAAAFNGTALSGTINGVTPLSGTGSAGFGNLTTIGFGLDPTSNNNFLNGHIRSFSYFNYALTNTQLQQVTT